jgi:hypothetical protein
MPGSLHMETDEVRHFAGILQSTLETLSQQAEALHSQVRAVDWSSPGRFAYEAEFSALILRIQQASQEGCKFSARLYQTVDRWEQAGSGWISAASLVGAGATAAAGVVGRGYYSPEDAGYGWLKPGERVYGSPVNYQKFSEMQVGNTCALYAQGTAMRAMGKTFDAEEAKKLGLEVGYFNLGFIDGSLGLGKVWQHYGIEYDSFHRGGFLDLGWTSDQDAQDAAQFLIKSIQSQKALVVGVDINALYKGVEGAQVPYAPLSGHAVWVTGLVTDSQGNVTDVCFNDTLVGKGTKVPVSNFLSAWASKKYEAIASQQSLK